MSVTLISVSQDTVVSNKHEERTRHYYVIFQHECPQIWCCHHPPHDMKMAWRGLCNVHCSGPPSQGCCHPHRETCIQLEVSWQLHNKGQRKAAPPFWADVTIADSCLVVHIGWVALSKVSKPVGDPILMTSCAIVVHPPTGMGCRSVCPHVHHKLALQGLHLQQLLAAPPATLSGCVVFFKLGIHLCLLCMLRSHSQGLHFNGLSQIFSSSLSYLIISDFEPWGDSLGNSLISCPSPFQKHVFASWWALFY